MPLKVVCFSTYLTRPPYYPPDYQSLKFIDALKGDEINGYAHVPVRGVAKRLENSNRREAIKWFADMAADYLDNASITPPLYLVPVPGHKAINSAVQIRTATIAGAIADEIGNGAVLKDVLRWRQEWVSAREGGTRDPALLYGNLKIDSRVRWNHRVVLVDDVCTSGGHLQACAAILRENGAGVTLALCAGRTVQESQTSPFSIQTENIDDFTPSL